VSILGSRRSFIWLNLLSCFEKCDFLLYAYDAPGSFLYVERSANSPVWEDYSIRKLLLNANQDPVDPPHSSECEVDKNVPIHISHLATLMQRENSITLIRDEYAEYIDIFDPVHRLDRWLLVTFAHFDPQYKMVLDQMIGNWSTLRARNLYNIEQVKLEVFKTLDTTIISQHSEAELFLRAIIHFGTFQMFRYFAECINHPTLNFDTSAQFGLSLCSFDEQIFYVLLSNVSIIQERAFAIITKDRSLWTTVAQPEYWSGFLPKLPPPENGHRSPYLDTLLDPCYSDGSMLSLRLADELIQRGHATSFGGLILGEEILRLVLAMGEEIVLVDDHSDQYNYIIKSTLELLVSYPNANLDLPSSGCFTTKIGSQIWQGLIKGVIGFTPLMIAVDGGFMILVAVLVDSGAKIQSKAPRGFSAIQLARQNCKSQHPRKVDWTKSAKSGYGRSTIFSVSLETDLKTLRILEDGLIKRNEKMEPDPVVHKDDWIFSGSSTQERQKPRGKHPNLS
jgi:hypothetical protein